jgi:hypothetical protein
MKYYQADWHRDVLANIYASKIADDYRPRVGSNARYPERNTLLLPALAKRWERPSTSGSIVSTSPVKFAMSENSVAISRRWPPTRGSFIIMQSGSFA